MAFCYLFKVSQGTSWNDLEKLSSEQKKACRRPSEYSAAAVLSVAPSLFSGICQDISIPHWIYQEYKELARTLPDGTRRCIVIRNSADSKQLVLYTAGRNSPLYAGITE